MKPIKSYKDLEIWQDGVQLVEDVYKLTGKFPKEEQFGLTSQMRRAAVSIPANVAEGYARNHRPELRQFLYVALGSLAELETLGIVAQRIGHLDQGSLEQAMSHLRHKTLAFLRSIR